VNLTQIKAAVEGQTIKDDEVTGLELRVRNGRKAFYFYYRSKVSGQRRRPKVGDWPTMTIPQAREVARAWYVEVQQGKDPSADNQALRASETVETLADRYIAEHQNKRSLRHDEGRIRRVIKPKWGTKKVAEVTRHDLLTLRREMAKTPIAFNRLVALVSAMWSFGEYPSITSVKPYKETARQRYLSPEERERFLAALDETEGQFPHAVAMIRLLYLTGARHSEIAKAKRSWYKDGLLTLKQHKTDADGNPKTIAFSKAAQAVVEGIDPRRGWLVGFASYPNGVWDLIRERAKLDDFRLHDLRHSFASDAIAAGYGLSEIGEALGHKDAGTTKRYAHLSPKAKMALAEKVEASRNDTAD
jgi:integrase